MKTIANYLLVVIALIIVIPVFAWCLAIALVKKIKGNEPMLYDRYVEE